MERVPLTYGHVAAACGGRLIRGDEAQAIEGISIDSRTLAAGDLFVAIRGDRKSKPTPRLAPEMVLSCHSFLLHTKFTSLLYAEYQ